MRQTTDGQAYAGRNPAMMPINLSLEKEAVGILRQHANGRRSYGRLLSRLLYEFEAKMEERKRIVESLQQVG